MNRLCRIALFGLLGALALAPCVAHASCPGREFHGKQRSKNGRASARARQATDGYQRRSLRQLLPVRMRKLQQALSHSRRQAGLRSLLHRQRLYPGCAARLLDKVAAKSAQHTANEQKIGDYYASCMDEDAMHAEGLKPLQPELDRIAALSDKKELTGLLAHYQMINVNAFFNYGEQQDFKDARKQIAVVDQGGLGLAGTRLLLPHRRRGRKDAQGICGARGEHAAPDGRAGRQGSSRRAKDHDAGNGAGQGIDGCYLAARSRQRLSPDAGGQFGRADAGDRLAEGSLPIPACPGSRI